MKPEAKSLLYVAIAGAVGGFTSWLLQWLAGLAPFQKPASEGIPALIVVGGVAAVFGVYLLANSNIRELPHTLAFALLCGALVSQPHGTVRDSTAVLSRHFASRPSL